MTIGRSFLLVGMLLSLTGCFQRSQMCWVGPCGPPAPAPPIGEFLGNWVNEDPKPGQIIRLVIIREDNMNYVQSWEACDQGECFLGKWTSSLELDGQERVVDSFGYREDQDKGVFIKLRKASEERLEASTETHFNYHSGGSLNDPQYDTYFFVKHQP